MRRSPADSTNRSLAVFGKLQHIRQECSIVTCQAAEVRASRERWSAIRAL